MAGTSSADKAYNRAQFDKARVNLETVLRAAHDANPVVLEEIGIALEGLIKNELKHQGTGRIYRRGNVTHQASAPGFAPASDTGAYMASWHHKVGFDALGEYVDVYTDGGIGAYLEFGTINMKPRPHVRPAAIKLTIALGGMIHVSVAAAEKMAAEIEKGKL